jgi:CRP-like cAMP-binding protein
MNIAIPANAMNSDRHSAQQQRRLPDRLEAVGITKRYRRDQEICSQIRPSESWYRVTAGAARKLVLLSNGRRQILDLLLAGDFFDDNEQEHDFTVEAVTEGTMVARYPHRRVEELADADPQLACEMRRIGFGITSRLEELILILGRTTALEKVGCFLLLMSERPAVRRGDGVVLPISRYDIADYLGLSVETVSRSLTELKQRGLIVLSGTRQITIINRTAIAEGDYSAARHGTGRIHPLSIPC